METATELKDGNGVKPKGKNGNRIKELLDAPIMEVRIPEPHIESIDLVLIGLTPYMQNRWTQKAIDAMRGKMKIGGGQASKLKGSKPPRDFDEDYRQSMHISTEGWHGIPVGAFRAALISACRLVGFKMTTAKLAIDVPPQGLDRQDGVGLVEIEGDPIKTEMMVKNATGVADIRVRPMWKEWKARITVTYDADIFSAQDVCNLISRAGLQVGIGAGRPDSENSVGMGFGKFKVLNQ